MQAHRYQWRGAKRGSADCIPANSRRRTDIVRVDDEAIDSALGIVPNSSLEIDNLAFAQVETCYVIFVHEQGHACTVNSPKAVAIRINRDAMS
jgi:hypothetical protein